MTSWYHVSIDTTDIPLGQYKVIIDDVDEDRELADFNRKIFNPNTGNFQTAVFEEFVPNGSITGNDDEGSQVTFLVNIVAPPPGGEEEDD